MARLRQCSHHAQGTETKRDTQPAGGHALSALLKKKKMLCKSTQFFSKTVPHAMDYGVLCPLSSWYFSSTEGRKDRCHTRFLSLSTIDIWSWIFLLWGAILCLLGYLTASLTFTHEMPVTIPTSVVTNRTASRYGLGAKPFPVKTHCVQVYNKCKKTEEPSMNYHNSTGEL